MLINTQGMKLINRQSSKKKLRPVPRKQQRAAALQYQDRTTNTSSAETSTPPLHTSINYPVNPFSASLFSTHLNALQKASTLIPFEPLSNYFVHFLYAEASLSPSHDRKENFYDMTRYLPEIGCFSPPNTFLFSFSDDISELWLPLLILHLLWIDSRSV